MTEQNVRLLADLRPTMAVQISYFEASYSQADHKDEGDVFEKI